MITLFYLLCWRQSKDSYDKEQKLFYGGKERWNSDTEKNLFWQNVKNFFSDTLKLEFYYIRPLSLNFLNCIKSLVYVNANHFASSKIVVHPNDFCSL